MATRIDLNHPCTSSCMVKEMVDNTPIGYVILDRNYRICYANDYVLQQRNMTREDILGDYCYNVSNNGKPCHPCSMRKALQSGRSELLHRKDIMPDGSVRYMDDHHSPDVEFRQDRVRPRGDDRPHRRKSGS